jgi:pimeloyl-ACP methyl ester carboxylesterase
MQKQQLTNKTFAKITYYKVGSGPAILLVHGFPANVHLWRNIVPELSKSFTLILPNFFEEVGDWLKDGATSMAQLAEAFNDILEFEKIERVLLIGHSMGGYMGLAFAEKYPQKLIGLSLVHSSSLGDDELRAEGRRKTVAILEGGGKRLFLKKMVPALFTDEFNSQNPEVVKRQLEEAIAVDDQSLVAFYKAIMERSETTQVVRNAKFPIQNVIGAKDSLASITKELAVENLAITNFVSVFENEAHMVMLENSLRLQSDLLLFAKFCWCRVVQ